MKWIELIKMHRISTHSYCKKSDNENKTLLLMKSLFPKWTMKLKKTITQHSKCNYISSNQIWEYEKKKTTTSNQKYISSWQLDKKEEWNINKWNSEKKNRRKRQNHTKSKNNKKHGTEEINNQANKNKIKK